jgi:hypothetical protein
LITWASCGALTNAVWNANSPNLWNNITRIKYTVHGWQRVHTKHWNFDQIVMLLGYRIRNGKHSLPTHNIKR